jgi:dephospho-CoA kinase
MLVALVGKQGVGKTTLADKMSTQGFKKLSFATPMRDMFQHVFGHNKVDRSWMQSFGEASRQVKEDIWTDKMNELVESYLPANIIIDDVRYQSEMINTVIPYINRVDGIVIKMNADEITRFDRRFQNANISRYAAKAIKEAYHNNPPPNFKGSRILFAAGKAGLDDEEMEKVYNWTQFQEHKSEVDLDGFEYTEQVDRFIEITSAAPTSEDDVFNKVLNETHLIHKDVQRKLLLI